MRAMVYRGPYKVRVEEKGVPSLEHANDAIVRVTLGAICGSDIHLYHGLMPDTRVGHTFGHEFIGVVELVGPSVRNLNRGDRVMVPFNVFCGSCFFCARGLYSNCHNVNPNATATHARCSFLQCTWLVGVGQGRCRRDHTRTHKGEPEPRDATSPAVGSANVDAERTAGGPGTEAVDTTSPASAGRMQ